MTTRIIAVIHHRDDETSARNVAVAQAAGCAGVALIQMQGRDHEIERPAIEAKRAHPGLIVVANRLSAKAEDAIARDLDLGLDGTWSDDQVVSSSGPLSNAKGVESALEGARKANPAFLFFASVAFKTHAVEEDPEAAAREASPFPWIVTTSGPATGTPPDAGKLRTMASQVGRARLGVASGIDPDNASILLPHVGWALVATGIGSDFHNLDPLKTRRLVEIASNR